MDNVRKQREKLISLLEELFQLDQPDLDFGFYRIMHAKADQVTKFLREDLLGIVRDAFGEADGSRVEQAKAAYEAARQQAIEYGAPDPDVTEPVKKAKAAWDAAEDSGSNEGDVYDHLYRFFERYYDNGDFMSRRYFARETDGKAAPYAVPYDGREVYLHWANRDQYYIKTSEYLTNFTFDPTQAKEFQDKHGALFEQKPLKVHCRIVSAAEGEHNNVKASEQTERYFIIHKPEPMKIELGDTGEPELVIQFQYRPDPEKTGQDGTWRKKRLAEAADKVKAALPDLEGAADYVTALMTPAPTEAEKDRSLLDKYLAQYTSRNTMDYFIHKDLGGFLRRELDFYIKNEVMRLDEIESADAPRVEAYLAKIKVLRRIAQHLINFLAQLEDFQKRLWLKRKFIVDTQYCVSMALIPDEHLMEVSANKAQVQEWIAEFCLDEIAGYTDPPSPDFLRKNEGLLLDTAYFSDEFKQSVVSNIQLGEDINSGELICGENSQALRLISKTYDSSAHCIYIDPPYNTDASAIAYKNGYKSSSWLGLINERLRLAKDLLPNDGVICVAIDDEQLAELSAALGEIFPVDLGTAVVRSNPQSRKSRTTLSPSHEYALFFGKTDLAKPSSLSLTDKRLARYPLRDEKGHYSWMSFIRTGTNELRTDRPKMHYPIIASVDGSLRIPDMTWHPERGVCGEYEINENLSEGEIAVYPVSEKDGKVIEKRWHRGWERVLSDRSEYRVRRDKNGKTFIDFKTRIDEKSTPSTWWDKPEYASANYGAIELKALFGEKPFDFPKAIALVSDCIRTSTDRIDARVLDFFAGSGTTVHSLISLNREDGGRRKFIAVEMGNHFGTVLLPRVKKAAYASEWEDGKPTEVANERHFIRYFLLETYEDALNNLTFAAPPSLPADQKDFYRDYQLRYWLDFETKGSPSLLNIEGFDDPTAYKLKIKKPGTDEYVEKAVDLVETFNWLIGLHVEHLDRWRGYNAAFKREVDPELPEDMNTRLMLDGALKEADDGAWCFRKVEGYTLRTPGDHNDREKALVVWRKLTGDLEQDNLMLDEWFRKYRLSAQDTEFDVIYVNGSNNLPNLRKDEEAWKVRLIEEAFHQAMWDVEG